MVFSTGCSSKITFSSFSLLFYTSDTDWDTPLWTTDVISRHWYAVIENAIVSCWELICYRRCFVLGCCRAETCQKLSPVTNWDQNCKQNCKLFFKLEIYNDKYSDPSAVVRVMFQDPPWNGKDGKAEARELFYYLRIYLTFINPPPDCITVSHTIISTVQLYSGDTERRWQSRWKWPIDKERCWEMIWCISQQLANSTQWGKQSYRGSFANAQNEWLMIMPYTSKTIS